MKLFWLVFACCLVMLSWHLSSTGIASGYIDPVLRLGAQDEATYTREALTMARDGGWMTPTFLGRWVFEKPPLLMWLSALSMRAFGIGRIPARLPVMLAGALICALCFAMVRPRRGVQAGLATAAMALTSQIIFTVSRHNMTDALLTAAGLAAFAILLRDPELRSAASLAGFVIAAAAGITDKSVAGILIVAVLGIVVGFGSRRWGRAMVAGALAVALGSPWFLYNFFLHRNWFLSDMGFQLITTGSGVHQTSTENHLWFYIVRILYSDLAPAILAMTALPALIHALRRREATALLVASYCVVYFAGLMAFRYHSEQFLSWFVPSLILIAGLYSPLLNSKGAPIVTALLTVIFAVKLANPDRAFGISVQPGNTIAAAPALSQYCEEHRAANLYIVGVDDEFYSAALPLHRVRYAWIDPNDVVAREHPFLVYLGVLITADDLPQLDNKMSVFRDHLRSWGLDSTQSVATGVTSHDIPGLLRIIKDHPESDFLVARSVLPDPESHASHRIAVANPEFTLLESKLPVAKETPSWACKM